ncbi:MAG: PUA domain-containing protein [Thermoproteota archaeon]|nr:PUA domain-containing protein [Thermoproteota archaeon]
MKTNLKSKSETSEILNTVSKLWNKDVPKIKNLKSHYLDNDSEILIGGDLKIIRIGEEYLPFLTELKLLDTFPNVTVDMGAVKFMCNGANVMRPGIKNYSEFSKDEIVCVVEESQNKFLAVGKSLVDSSEMEQISKGEIIKNLHYISDKFWEISKTI